MSDTINLRASICGRTSLSSVLNQRIIADSGQCNRLTMESAIGSYISIRSCQCNKVEVRFAEGNRMDLRSGQSNTYVVVKAKGNIIDMRSSQSNKLNLSSGEGNVVNLSSAQANRIILGSGSDHNGTVYDCGQGNQIIVNGRRGKDAEDVQCLRYGSYRLIWYRNNFIIQKPSDPTTQNNTVVVSGCNGFTFISSNGYSGVVEDKDDFADAPTAMTSDDVKRLPTRRLYSTVAAQEMRCGICKHNFRDGNVLRILPCLHEFHVQCADEFLSSNRVCPKCHHIVYGGE